MTERLAKLYVQGEVCTARLLGVDKATYIGTLLVMLILDGGWAGEKIAVFENGDKFQEWVK